MLEYAKITLIFSIISDYYYFQIKPVLISILFGCPCFKLPVNTFRIGVYNHTRRFSFEEEYRETLTNKLYVKFN